jgi:ATP-dependent 26S proteasome regulatory subunit
LGLALKQNKQREQVYFTNWLAESMHRMTLEKQLDAMNKLHADEIANMSQKYEAQQQQLKEEFDTHTSSGNAEFVNMKNNLNATMNEMKSKLLDQINNMQQQHAGEGATLMAEVSEMKNKNAELNTVLQERNATVLALTGTLKQTQALLQEANKKSAALESTMTVALTRRRHELAVTLQRLADVTILFLHVSQRCEEMDNAFGVLGKKWFCRYQLLPSLERLVPSLLPSLLYSTLTLPFPLFLLFLLPSSTRQSFPSHQRQHHRQRQQSLVFQFHGH